MMTPEEKGSLPIRVEKLFYELQDRIFSDIVRRIRKTKKITSTADYQINKLLLLGGSTEFIESETGRPMSRSTGASLRWRITRRSGSGRTPL